MNGAGLRLSELVRLRIKDVDLERGTLTVRMGKGDPSPLRYAAASKDRMTVLPKSLREQIAEQIEKDRATDLPGVAVPNVYDRKDRRAGEKWPWQWLLGREIRIF